MKNKEDYETINDLSETGFEKVTDKGLLQHACLSHRDKIKLEMNRRLRKSIDKFNENSSRYSIVIIVLTIIMGIASSIQIYLLIK